MSEEDDSTLFSPRILHPKLEKLTSMSKFHVAGKGGDPESLATWRKYSLALNATRRFRYTADLEKRRELQEALEVLNYICCFTFVMFELLRHC